MPRSRTLYSHICASCREPFTSIERDQPYCSRACYAVARRMAERICRTCGATFQPIERNQHYCSRACVAGMQSGLFANRITKVCERCGASFAAKPSRAAESRYCSRRCLSAANKEQARVRRLEQGGTQPERRVRSALETLGLQFIPEHTVSVYSIDFFLPHHHIALEVDGVYWHSLHPTRDSQRDAALAQMGITTVRLTDRAVMRASDVTALVRDALQL